MTIQEIVKLVQEQREQLFNDIEKLEDNWIHEVAMICYEKDLENGNSKIGTTVFKDLGNNDLAKDIYVLAYGRGLVSGYKEGLLDAKVINDKSNETTN